MEDERINLAGMIEMARDLGFQMTDEGWSQLKDLHDKEELTPAEEKQFFVLLACGLAGKDDEYVNAYLDKLGIEY